MSRYAREAQLTDRVLVQLAQFFVGALARPRPLVAEARGVIRDRIRFGGHVTIADAVHELPLPERLKDYVMLRNEAIVGFEND